jgi:hypothetical protein
MPKLKKRLPESRSEKRERLASESELNRRQKEQARARHAVRQKQQERESQVFLEWRTLMKRRLEFEAFHRQYWDYFRFSGMPDAELALTVQRWKDTKPVAPEVVLEYLESQRRLSVPLARIAKQLAFRGEWSEGQRRRLQKMVLRHLEAPRWHANFKYLARLSRALDDETFYDEVHVRSLRSDIGGEMAIALLTHLRQERTMKRS